MLLELSIMLSENIYSIGITHDNGIARFKKCQNTNIYSYLETSGGENSNLYLNVLHFFNTSVCIGHMWQLKTVVLLHRCRIRDVHLSCDYHNMFIVQA
jgi:hypothetical protein